MKMQYSMVKIFVKIVLATLVASVAAEPLRHFATDGRQYVIETEQKHNWFSAWQECARHGHQLLEIKSSEKNQIIIQLLNDVIGKPMSLWLAAHDELNPGTIERQFHWLPTGAEMSFSHWNENEPNNQGNIENCALIFSGAEQYQWNDGPCNTLRGYICEENHFRLQYNDTISEVLEKNQLLLQLHEQQQQNIQAINMDCEQNIENLSVEGHRAIEQLQINLIELIQQLNAKRTMAIDQVLQNYGGHLNATMEDVAEILEY